MLIAVDHQVGLYNLARDFDPTLFRDQLLAHTALGKVFNLPVILTTSPETGPNGPLGDPRHVPRYPCRRARGRGQRLG